MLATSPFTYIPPLADWLRILPELLLAVFAFLTLLADLALPDGRKGWLALIGLVGALAAAVTLGIVQGQGGGAGFYGMVTSDGVAVFSDAVILLALGLGLLFSPGYLERQRITREGEYYSLMQFGALGMMFMASATNLMMVFVGLETLSLSLYVLCALAQSRLRSQESGMKYFILSSFASAFLLYGIALTYGSTGSASLATISHFLAGHQASQAQGFGPLLIVGIGLMVVGFGFKVSAVPFQAWTPDVYSGAPTPVTAFMSVGTKVAAFAALARVFVYALATQNAHWEPVIWALAAVTMVAGNLMAVSQRDVKRMLAYSSVANAGYLLVAIVTATSQSLSSLLFYLAAYGAMNLGAFGVVALVERNDGTGARLEDFRGLARRQPALAAAMALFLFSLAGVPPTAGFIAKYLVFYAAMVGGQVPLAIIGIISSVLGMFYYLRVIRAMYFDDPRVEVAAGHAYSAVPAPVEREPALVAAVGANGTGAGVEAAGVAATAEPVSDASQAAAPAPIRVPFPSAVALVVAGALTLGLIIFAGPLSGFALNAAAALFSH